MIAAILFTVSVVALIQFGVYYWRAMIAGVAAQAVSDRIRVAAGISSSMIGAQDFRNILILNDLSPELRGPAGSFRGIRAYYAVVEKLGSIIPAMAIGPTRRWRPARVTSQSSWISTWNATWHPQPKCAGCK